MPLRLLISVVAAALLCSSGAQGFAQDRATEDDYDRSHWSLRPRGTPQPPARDEPADRDWLRNDVDAFVLARLKAARLRPAAEADRRTLIRRLHFDLLGLPPEPAEVEAFVGDSSVDAHERLVDRLLASPHYGERWGQHWLDVIR